MHARRWLRVEAVHDFVACMWSRNPVTVAPVDHRERDLLDCGVVMSGDVAQKHVPGLAARRDRVPGCAALAGQECGEPLAEVPVEAVRSLSAGLHGVAAGMMPAAEVRPVAARRSGSRWTYHAVEEYFWCPMQAAR